LIISLTDPHQYASKEKREEDVLGRLRDGRREDRKRSTREDGGILVVQLYESFCTCPWDPTGGVVSERKGKRKGTNESVECSASRALTSAMFWGLRPAA
jgi:hypothetical protein